MLEKLPAVARMAQTRKTSSATNATIRCAVTKAGRGGDCARRGGRQARRRGGGEARAAGRREGKQASGRAHSRRKPKHHLSREYKPRNSYCTTEWGAFNHSHRATKTQTQIMGTVLTVRVQNWDRTSSRITTHSEWKTTESESMRTLSQRENRRPNRFMRLAN